MAEARAAKTEAGATVKEQARALVEQREEAAAKTAVAKVEAGEQLGATRVRQGRAARGGGRATRGVGACSPRYRRSRRRRPSNT